MNSKGQGLDILKVGEILLDIFTRNFFSAPRIRLTFSILGFRLRSVLSPKTRSQGTTSFE